MPLSLGWLQPNALMTHRRLLSLASRIPLFFSPCSCTRHAECWNLTIAPHLYRAHNRAAVQILLRPPPRYSTMPPQRVPLDAMSFDMPHDPLHMPRCSLLSPSVLPRALFCPRILSVREGNRPSCAEWCRAPSHKPRSSSGRGGTAPSESAPGATRPAQVPQLERPRRAYPPVSAPQVRHGT
jgi:hypothetical protein